MSTTTASPHDKHTMRWQRQQQAKRRLSEAQRARCERIARLNRTNQLRQKALQDKRAKATLREMINAPHKYYILDRPGRLIDLICWDIPPTPEPVYLLEEAP